MSLTTKYRGGFNTRYTKTADLAGATQDIPFNAQQTIATGTASGKADLLFSDTRTLAASTSENLDLAASLVDFFGNTLTFVKIKAIYVSAAAGNGGNIAVGGAGSNTFIGPFANATDIIELPAGAYIEVAAPTAGWTVTAGTGDILKIENDDSGASGTYTIQIIGTSA